MYSVSDERPPWWRPSYKARKGREGRQGGKGCGPEVRQGDLGATCRSLFYRGAVIIYFGPSMAGTSNNVLGRGSCVQRGKKLECRDKSSEM